MQLLLATTNPGKIVEMSEALSGIPLEILTLEDVRVFEPPPEEHADTFAENALIKSRFYADRTQFPTVADDSGILVDALANELGVHTRRWGAGAAATDAQWIEHFLQRLAHEENRNARFVCHLSYIDGSGGVHAFEGSCEGIITPTLEADYLPGLPISACFKPHGFDTVYSAMTPEEKNRISHRGRALQKLREHLKQRGANFKVLGAKDQ